MTHFNFYADKCPFGFGASGYLAEFDKIAETAAEIAGEEEGSVLNNLINHSKESPEDYVDEIEEEGED